MVSPHFTLRCISLSHPPGPAFPSLLPSSCLRLPPTISEEGLEGRARPVECEGFDRLGHPVQRQQERLDACVERANLQATPHTTNRPPHTRYESKHAVKRQARLLACGPTDVLSATPPARHEKRGEREQREAASGRFATGTAVGSTAMGQRKHHSKRLRDIPRVQ